MATHYNPRIVSEDLQIYIDFANNRCYSGQGVSFNNLIKNSIGYFKNNSIFSQDFGGIVRTNGAGDPAVSNVVGDRIDINTTAANIDRFKKETSFAFSFWIRWISGSRIFSTGSSGSGNTDNCIWQFYATTNLWYWWDSSGGGTNNLSVSYPSLIANQWCMMSYVYSHSPEENNTITVFRDGQQIAFNSRSNATHNAIDRTAQTNLQYTLGGGYEGGCRNNNSVCDFANFITYNRALTPQEVQQNFNATRGRFGL